MVLGYVMEAVLIALSRPTRVLFQDSPWHTCGLLVHVGVGQKVPIPWLCNQRQQFVDSLLIIIGKEDHGFTKSCYAFSLLFLFSIHFHILLPQTGEC